MRKNDVPVKVSRWAMFLQDFEYTIEHRPGTRMKHVDALSRVHTLLLQDSVRHRIQQAQRQETNTYDDFYLKHEVFHKNSIKELIVIPSAMENEIIKTAHRQGHFGVKRTIDLVQRNYYIPYLEKKAQTIVKSCVECIVGEAKYGKK
ncbi:uncharacterized protein [Drosophila takahashii]|uniref:uncharacterized protein n=1 Tax=Drosophila takahashii TaxID=29030 RepID=UPI0038991AF4